MKVSADSGFHDGSNVRCLYDEGVDGYLADTGMRHRDPVYAEAKAHHKPRAPHWKRQGSVPSPKPFDVSAFRYDAAAQQCHCAAGKRLGLNRVGEFQGRDAVRFRGPKSICDDCRLRTRCLRNPASKTLRTVTFFGAQAQQPNGPLQWMREKMDSVQGKVEYAKRLETAEPPFANIRWAMGLNRFTLRGKRKVDSQWQLYCMVRNIGKSPRYGYSDTG